MQLLMRSYLLFCTAHFLIISGFADSLSSQTAGSRIPAMGRAMLKEFLLDPNFTQLNHGSYGTYPKAVQAALHAYQLRSERNIELWVRRDARIELDKIRVLLAKFMNAEAENLVVVPNTTGGIIAILRSLYFNPGDKIMHFSTTYGAMKNVIQYICDAHNGTVTPVELKLFYPMSNSKLIKDFVAFLDINHQPKSPIRIALVDHVSSVPAVVNPIKKMIEILKARNILVLIDGAHAIGQVSIDLKYLQPDYYITDCHKWLFAARGSAVMYVNKRLQSSIHPPHISWNYAVPARFQDEFFWTGTIDYSSYMTIPAALEFRRNAGGEDAIRNYTHNLAREGGKLLAKRFKTVVLQDEEQMGSMVDVALPLVNSKVVLEDRDFWVNIMLDRFNIYATTYKHNGRCWIRVSAQIYNDLSDYETAARVFSTICDEMNSKNSTG